MSGDAEAKALLVLIVWYRENRPHHCFYCGRHLLTRPRRSSTWPHGRPKPNQRTMDHVNPLCSGGLNHNENKVACCPGCNNLKAGRSLEAFRQFVVHRQHFKGMPAGRFNLVGGRFFGEREYESFKN